MSKPEIVSTDLIITDAHISHEDTCDDRAYNLMIQVACNLPLTGIIIGGDYADMYAVTGHDKDPRITLDLAGEISAVNEKLDELDFLFPNTRRVYLVGNHEDRFRRYLAKKAPELYEITDCKSLFKMDERGWTWVPFENDQMYRPPGTEALVIRHTPLAGSEHSAAGSVKKAMASVIHFHTHRVQEFQVVNAFGKVFRGISSGWLGNKDHPAMRYIQGFAQWQQGFGILRTLSDGRWFYQTVHIIEYSCCVDGVVYHG